MKLNELKIGQCARITSVGGEGALRQHFLDMGVIPGNLHFELPMQERLLLIL